MKISLLAASALLGGALFSPAQTPSPSPSSVAAPSASPADNNTEVAPAPPPLAAIKMQGARIQFLPPPMEGTISLGIYDAAGKLVRTLHREAEVDGKEFLVDSDGLVTAWDGKDDAGKPAPKGTYAARGYSVGDLKIKGEAILGNDWITDAESPRIAEIKELWSTPSGGFGLMVILADGQLKKWLYTAAGDFTQGKGGGAWSAIVREGKIVRFDDEGEHVLDLKGLIAPIRACVARYGGVWVIDREAEGVAVKEFGPDGAYMRHLAIAPGDPQPEQIAASPVADTIFLLERNASEQRVRALTLIAPAPSATASPSAAPSAGPPVASTWKVLFKKSIWKCDTLAAVQARLTMPDGAPFQPAATASIALAANPLTKNSAPKATVAVGLEHEGSMLKLADGLPLHRISNTPNLRWIALATDRSGKLIIFQSDGAAVEEFRIAQPGSMMAFDAGEVEPSEASPIPSP